MASIQIWRPGNTSPCAVDPSPKKNRRERENFLPISLRGRVIRAQARQHKPTYPAVQAFSLSAKFARESAMLKLPEERKRWGE